MEIEKALLEAMQPHDNLKKLELKGYHGEAMPRWPGDDNLTLFHLPNLVNLCIFDCSGLCSLPSLGELPCLKKLKLEKLPNVEYVVGSIQGSPLFQCLEHLNLKELPKLKGWWPGSAGSSMEGKHLTWISFPGFAQLKKLRIKECQMMASIPICSGLESLLLEDYGRCLSWDQTPSSIELSLTDLEWLKSMPTNYFKGLTLLSIRKEKNVESLGEVRELLHPHILSSIHSLEIVCCPKLKSDGGWLEQLSALQSLRITACDLDLVNGIQWELLSRSLRRLTLVWFEEWPQGLQNCTFLHSLVIWNCPKLQCVPSWMPKLASLQKLELVFCSETLKERCEKPDGQDWPLIQHIPLFCIRNTTYIP